jgi:hypothetical protein
MFFGMVMGPLLGQLSPGTRSELILKLFPKLIRYIESFSILTVVMGVALALSITKGDLSPFSPATSFGRYITAGATVALVTIAIALGVVAPSGRKVLRITQDLVKNPGPPPPELAKTSRRMRTAATSVVVLLLIVLIFMVAAAWP